MSDSLLGLLWRRRQARRRLEAAQEAEGRPATEPCVRCQHTPDDHHPDGCVITGCPCLHYVAPA